MLIVIVIVYYSVSTASTRNSNIFTVIALRGLSFC